MRGPISHATHFQMQPLPDLSNTLDEVQLLQRVSILALLDKRALGRRDVSNCTQALLFRRVFEERSSGILALSKT
jgi:hypothetical protein